MVRHLPRAIGRRGYIPHTFFNQVVQTSGYEHSRARILDIHEIGTVDRLVNGLTVILDFDVRLAPFNSSGLRDMGIQYCILCLLGAGDINTRVCLV
jgi:hypothetical protein